MGAFGKRLRDPVAHCALLARDLGMSGTFDQALEQPLAKPTMTR